MLNQQALVLIQYGQLHFTSISSGSVGTTQSALTSDGTPKNAGVSVSIPAAGTYLLNWTGRFSSNLMTAQFAFFTLFDTTNSAVLVNSEVLSYDAAAVPIAVQLSTSGHYILTAAGAVTIQLQITGSAGGATMTVFSDTSGRTTLSYIRIA